MMPARRYLVWNVVRAQIGPDKRGKTGQHFDSKVAYAEISEQTDWPVFLCEGEAVDGFAFEGFVPWWGLFGLAWFGTPACRDS